MRQQTISLVCSFVGIIGVLTLLAALLYQWWTNRDQKRDWFKFGIHFFFGSLVGALLGIRLWGGSHHGISISIGVGITSVIITALVIGLIAGALSQTGWDE
jgi:uncharacterized membrane protein YedE/YeeE